MGKITHPEEIRKQALADLSRGEQPAIVAERYGLNRKTVRSWKLRFLTYQAHQCATCGKSSNETTFRTNGSGALRAECNACENAKRKAKRQSIAEKTQPPDDTPRVADGYTIMPYQGAVIAWDTDGGMVCLTDLWRAAHEPENKRPVDWLRSEPAKEYIEACRRRDVLVAGTHQYTRPGVHGGTWHKKIVGLEYARYLNADLAVACNEFVLNQWGRARNDRNPDDLLQRIAEHLGIIPGMDAKLTRIIQTVSGATLIKKTEYHRGRIYIGRLTDVLTIQSVRRELFNPPNGLTLVFIGRTMAGEGQESVRISGYTSKLLKMRPTYYDLLAAFDTDDPIACENLILANPPRGAQQAMVSKHKKSLSFHLSTSDALDEYRSLTRSYYPIVDLQATWPITSLGPAQAGLW